MLGKVSDGTHIDFSLQSKSQLADWWGPRGEANDVLGLVQEPFCLLESHVSSDPKHRLPTPKRPFSKSWRGTVTVAQGLQWKSARFSLQAFWSSSEHAILITNVSGFQNITASSWRTAGQSGHHSNDKLHKIVSPLNSFLKIDNLVLDRDVLSKLAMA